MTVPRLLIVNLSMKGETGVTPYKVKGLVNDSMTIASNALKN